MKEYDIRIAIHNHGPEDKLWPSPFDVLKVVNGMDPRMGCCIDVGHTVRAGTERRLKPSTPLARASSTCT